MSIFKAVLAFSSFEDTTKNGIFRAPIRIGVGKLTTFLCHWAALLLTGGPTGRFDVTLRIRSCTMFQIRLCIHHYDRKWSRSMEVPNQFERRSTLTRNTGALLLIYVLIDAQLKPNTQSQRWQQQLWCSPAWVLTNLGGYSCIRSIRDKRRLTRIR